MHQSRAVASCTAFWPNRPGSWRPQHPRGLGDRLGRPVRGAASSCYGLPSRADHACRGSNQDRPQRRGADLGGRGSRQQLVHLVAQPLVQGADALKVGPDPDHARDDGVVRHRPPLRLQQGHHCGLPGKGSAPAAAGCPERRRAPVLLKCRRCRSQIASIHLQHKQLQTGPCMPTRPAASGEWGLGSRVSWACACSP